jgi:hypothetical protein
VEGTWHEVPRVISSERASPAAKRLALRLTFAVYIMGPQLVGSDNWHEHGSEESASVSQLDLFKIVQSRITSVPYQAVLEAPSAIEQQQRVDAAMMISLLAVGNVVVQMSCISRLWVGVRYHSATRTDPVAFQTSQR